MTLTPTGRQPDGSKGEIATPLACHLENALSELLQGQSFELACLIGHPELCEGVLLESPHGSRHEGSEDDILEIIVEPENGT